MSIVNKLSLRQQIWLGFFSLLFLIVIIASISFYRLLQLQDQATDIAESAQPAMLKALSLKENIRTTTSTLGLYIITKTSEYENQLKSDVTQLKQTLEEYKQLPVILSDEQLSQDAAALEAQIQQFIIYEKKVAFLTKNFIENYPALKIANTEINPRHQQALQIFSSMIESEFDESTSSKRRIFLQDLNNLRQNWMTVVTLFRTFLANPNQQRIDQIKIYMEQNTKQFNSVSQKADLFTFEQEEGFSELEHISKNYFKFIDEIFQIYMDGKWRVDVELINNEINPTIAGINQKIDAMIAYQKNNVNESNQQLIAKTKSSIAYIVIALMISLAIGIFAARFSSKQINTVVREVNQILTNILNGDFTLRMNTDRAGDIGRLAGTVNHFSKQLEIIIGEIKSSVSHLQDTSSNLTSITHTTTTNVAQQNNETEMVATATEEMSLTAQEVANNTMSAAESAQHANSDAQMGSEKSNAAMSGIRNLVQNLNNSADVIHTLQTDTNNISVVLDVIREISEQTNLLALNAAIEAARAGEQGRGFAVVADEVRTLASRTQESTDQIKDLIDRLQLGADNAVNAMQSSINEANNNSEQVAEVSSALEKIKNEIININSVLTQVASSSEQQSATANEIASNISSISNISSRTSESTELLDTAEKDLSNVTNSLDNVISVFNSETA